MLRAHRIGCGLAAIGTATGIRFERNASLARFTPSDAGRATAEELFSTALAWRELVETVGRRVREIVSLGEIQHLKTYYQSLSGVLAPVAAGESTHPTRRRCIPASGSGC
jgi:hypothetical protein